MKRVIKNRFLRIALLLPVVVVVVNSCEKDKDGNPPGVASSNPTAKLIRPDSGAGNTALILEGVGLAEMRSIVFDNKNVPATFNPNFNSDNSLVFRVPDTAFGGPQNIIFTNKLGKTVTVPFRVIALSSVASVSDYSFTGGQTITLTGNNLDDVTKVAYDAAPSVTATVVSKTRKVMVITMPASTVTSTKLQITNSSGTITTTQEFINADQAYVFFRDSYGNSETDASWGDGGAVSTAQKISGASSLGKKFAKGNWHNLGIGWNSIAQGAYQNLSFWIKGGLIDHEDVFVFANSPGGPGHEQSQTASNKITVKAGIWQYFKIPLSKLNLWADGNAGNGFTINKLGWFLKGPDNDDETLYVDDVMFIK